MRKGMLMASPTPSSQDPDLWQSISIFSLSLLLAPGGPLSGAPFCDKRNCPFNQPDPSSIDLVRTYIRKALRRISFKSQSLTVIAHWVLKRARLDVSLVDVLYSVWELLTYYGAEVITMELSLDSVNPVELLAACSQTYVDTTSWRLDGVEFGNWREFNKEGRAWAGDLTETKADLYSLPLTWPRSLKFFCRHGVLRPTHFSNPAPLVHVFITPLCCLLLLSPQRAFFKLGSCDGSAIISFQWRFPHFSSWFPDHVAILNRNEKLPVPIFACHSSLETPVADLLHPLLCEISLRFTLYLINFGLWIPRPTDHVQG